MTAVDGERGRRARFPVDKPSVQFVPARDALLVDQVQLKPYPSHRQHTGCRPSHCEHPKDRLDSPQAKEAGGVVSQTLAFNSRHLSHAVPTRWRFIISVIREPRTEFEKLQIFLCLTLNLLECNKVAPLIQEQVARVVGRTRRSVSRPDYVTMTGRRRTKPKIQVTSPCRFLRGGNS